jgi:hypothetical protein
VHSAHVLHRLTGRDVASLGIGGAGSVQAMVRQPARILNGNCFLYPRLDPPRQIVVYVYEGNDLDENGYIVGRVAGEGAVTRETIARHVGERYGAPPRLRCFTDLGETMFKMGHFLITNTESFETLRKPSTRNKVLAGGAAHAAPALQKPPAERDASALEASFMVFDVSLEWLRRNFSAPVTIVYLPSPAAIYRHGRAIGRRLHALALERGTGDACRRHLCGEPAHLRADPRVGACARRALHRHAPATARSRCFRGDPRAAGLEPFQRGGLSGAGRGAGAGGG